MERFDDEGLYSLHGGGEWNLFLGFLYCGSRWEVFFILLLYESYGFQIFF